MALKYAAHCQFAVPTLKQLDVTSYIRDTSSNMKQFRYEIFVEWSDETRFTLCRLYSDFYQFHSELEAMFPVQAGQISEKERTLPVLPSKKSSIFKSSITPKVMQDRMQVYLQGILKLEDFILRSSVIGAFFKSKDEFDHKLRGRGQNPSLHPLSNTGGVVIEEFVAVGEFKAKEKSNQLSLKKGDVLSVLVKEGGWWFCECEGKSGWAPSTFLEQLDTSETDRNSDVMPISERNQGKYRALAAFVGTEGQHQCVPGDVFLVLEKDADGWWLALKIGIEDEDLQEAWIPAAYLEALDEEYDEESKDSEPEKYTVIEGYVSKSDDELTIVAGTVIEVLKKNQDGWWFCKLGEESGFFPAFNIEPLQETSRDTLSVSSVGSTSGNKYSKGRNAAASTTVFNKVKDFRASGRRDKRTTVRHPPPRVSTIPVLNSVSSDNFINQSKNIRISVTSLEGHEHNLTTPVSGEKTSFKEDLQLSNPAPESAVPLLGPLDANEVKLVKTAANKRAVYTRSESKRNCHLLMQQVEQKKRAITSVTEDCTTPVDSLYGQEGVVKRQNLKLEALKNQVSDVALSVIQMNTKIDHLETLLKEVLAKLPAND